MEAIEAAAWYEQQRPGLGGEFQAALDTALDLLEQQVPPLTAMPMNIGESGLKRLLLDRFPYSVVVLEREADLLVLAFAHGSRRPGYWRDRIDAVDR